MRPRSRSKRILASLAVAIFTFVAINSPAAAVRAVWRSTGTSALPIEQIGTTQWVDVVLDVDAAGLSAYGLNLFLDPNVLQLIGTVTETPPAPLQSTGAAIVNGSVIQRIEAQILAAEMLSGPTSVVVASIEVSVTGESQSAVEPSIVHYIEGSNSPPDVEIVVATIGTPPPVLRKMDYSFEIVATTEDAAYDSFLRGGSLGAHRRVVFLTGDPPNLEEIGPQQVILFENNTLTVIADNGSQFNTFSKPRINSNGHVTFFATDGGKTDDERIKFDQGLYEYNGSLDEFLSVNPDTPLLVGINALGQSPIINDNDEVVFSANYFDFHDEPETRWSLPFDTIHWQDISVPNSEPVELYRGSDPEGYVNRPATYNGIEPPYGFNNSGQVLFFAYTVGAFPNGQGELLLGGVEAGLPVAPVLVASETDGIYEDISISTLNEDGTVIFHALLNGDTDYSIFRWKDGTVETIVGTDNPFDIRYQDSLGFVSRNDRVVFADSLNSLFMWMPTTGIRQIFFLRQGPNSGDILSDANDDPIRPPELTGWLQNLIGVDDLGRVALNMEWEDGVQTILLATPALNLLDFRDIIFNSGEFQLIFDGETGASLNLESTTNLIDWNVITNFTTGKAPVPLNDPNAADADLKFYRVVPASQ